ncbi:ABC transporter permease [Streptomyces sp. PKU-EA00015]|uniref:ABC transporter permease n=1 Tax=Streptomyces sp. PKU-EA00015 TaxID=2748326 RepID=UPI0015A03350|nr:ABC transporter permease [Streptomyces sp. PKU-EA00015]NWF28447.1 ABC transporter permease [Streptomyces sp. PKU-EA00015]
MSVVPAATTPTTLSAPATLSVRPVLRSEWLKIRTVRSQCLTLASVFAATVGFSALMCATFSAEELSEPGFDPVHSSFFGLNFGQIAAVCFGSIAVAGEYRDGGIRVSLAAVPRRGVFWAGKIAVVGLLSLAVGLATSAACFALGQTLLGDDGVGIGAPGALRAVVGCGLYLALITLLAAGLAALLRSAPAVMGILIPFLLMLSFVLGDVSQGGGWVDFLPDRAGQQILLQEPDGPLGPWTGTGVLVLWVAAALWAGGRRLMRRDA